MGRATQTLFEGKYAIPVATAALFTGAGVGGGLDYVSAVETLIDGVAIRRGLDIVYHPNVRRNGILINLIP